jgi:hypothetical protein
MTQLRAAVVAIAVVTAAAIPASASAADFYVDRDTGNNTNDCSTPALACDTIGRGVTFATNAGSGNTVRVDDSGSPYSESSVSLFSGVSVIADNGVAGTAAESPTGRPIIQTTAAQALFVSGTDTAGTVSGFTFRPNDQAAISASGTMVAIQDNVFEDPAATGADIGITLGATSPVVSGNEFTDLQFGISFVGAGSAQITDNEFSGIHNGNPINIGAGSPTLTGNFIHDPGASAAQAVRIGGFGPTAPIAATFRRNTIIEAPGLGVNISDVSGPISFQGDVIAGADLSGISIVDSDDNGDAEVSASNVTIVSNAGATSEVLVENTELTLDSSIVGDEGIATAGAGTCSISFSRGPVSAPGGTGCGNFQTTADPLFVNAPAQDFHLQAGSPMVDAGNPAAPAPGTLDLDGDARVLEGDGTCPIDPRRDIGADELVGAPLDCTPAAAPPAVTPPKKKCKKGRKLKKGKCVKKKRRKK